MKYYLIAGEKSGDLHGSNLIRAIRGKDNNAEFRCYGGEEMQKAGAELVTHYRDIAIMGIPEAVKKLWKLRGYFYRCKSDIIKYQPDVIILIDFAGFNVRIARFAKNSNFRVFYYISPKVWAWNTSRAWKIKKYVDRMFVILPFEKEFYRKFEFDVDYVGNPVVDAVSKFILKEGFDPSFQNNDKPIIAVLPGSRKQEVLKMLPVMTEVIKMHPEYYFLIAGVNTLPQSTYATAMTHLPENAQIIMDRTYEILSVARAAIVTSGTATLETALWNVPQVVGYKASHLTYTIATWFVKIKFFSLVNLIADDNIVKELLQNECNPDSLSDELRLLMENNNRRNQVLKGYEKVKNILGEESASEKTADLMISYLTDGKKLESC